MSDVERNIGVVRGLEDAYNHNDLDSLGGFLTEDFVTHTAGSEQLPPGIEGAKMAHQGGVAGFPDRRTEILDVFGEDDRVVARVQMTGTNTGGLPFLGLAANGKAVDLQWIQVSRHGDDGRIVETWAQMDVPKMLQQLGAMPGPEGM